jgi:uncharacterized repeat protein (TIGR03803 family)
MTRISPRKLSRLHTGVACAFILLAASLVAAVPAAQAQYTVFANLLRPNGDMIRDPDGFLIGFSGWPGDVFKVDSSGVVTIGQGLGCGAPSVGCEPAAGPFRDPEGNLYGTTTSGQRSSVFELDTNNVLTALHVFKGGVDDGSSPNSTLVSINGELYGTTYAGGGTGCSGSLGCGTIYKVTKDGVFTIVYRFTGGADGAYPQGVIRDTEGNLYGVAESNVTVPGGGTVFKLDTTGAFTVLYTFGLVDATGGLTPVGRLSWNPADGSITGATKGGGTCCGVVFRLDANGNETVIHNFFGRETGSGPNAGVLDVGGVLYGTTSYGGDMHCYLTSHQTGCGVLYRISQTGQYSVLHRFVGCPNDGSLPFNGGLTLGADGSIYGATRKGGGGNCTMSGEGTIFKYTP